MTSKTVEKGEAMKAVLSLCRSCIYGNKVHGDCGIGPEKLECEKYNPKNSRVVLEDLVVYARDYDVANSGGRLINKKIDSSELALSSYYEKFFREKIADESL